MKKYIFLLGGLFFYLTLSAQRPPLFKVIDPQPTTLNTDLADNIFSIDSFYYISYGYFGQEWAEDGVVKTDKEGKVLRSIILKEDQEGLGISSGSGHIVTRDGNIILAGQCHSFTKNRQSVCVYKMTPDLQILWKKYYGNPAYDYYCISVVETPEGHYAIYGSDNRNNGNTARLRLMTTDTSGTLMWDRIVPDTFAWSANGNMVLTRDSNLIITAQAYRFNNRFPYGAQLFKTDLQGRVMWQRTLPYMQFNITLPFSAPLADGGCATLWAKDTVVWNGPWKYYDVNPSFPTLRRYDKDGHWLWEREWHKNFRTVKYITTAANGDILGGGYSHLETSDYSRAWLFRMSPEGEERWSRFFSDSLQRPKTSLRIWDLEETAEGDIIATGEVDDTIPDGRPANLNFFLLRVGPDGCLQKNCGDSLQYITAVRNPGIRGLFGSLPNLRVAPNPVHTELHLTLPEGRGGQRQLEWYSLSGRLVHTVAIDYAPAGPLTLPAPALPDGAYWLTLREGGLPTAKQLILLIK